MKSRLVFGCVFVAGAALAADRTIGADYALSADETVDGALTVAEGATVDLNGYNITVKGLDGGGTVTNTAPLPDLTSPDPNGARVTWTANDVAQADLYGSTTPLNLFNNNYERSTSGSTRRLITKAESLPLAVTYDFGAEAPKKVDMYKLYVGPLDSVYKRGPKTWTFEGSNDNATWTLLDSRDGETWPKTQETRTYTFDNAAAYRYYRFTFIAATDTSFLEAVQLEYFDTSATPELRVDVPAGASVTNSSVSIGGRVRFAKLGAGEFVAAKTNQTYSGGTRIAAGTLKPTAIPKHPVQTFGLLDTDIVVESGATFDINGSARCSLYRYVMNGGTAQNTGEALDSGHAQLADMTLTADSFVGCTNSLGFIKSSNAPLTIDLGGHVLEVAAGPETRIVNADITNGTLRIVRGTGSTVYFSKKPSRAPTATLDMDALVGAYSDLPVGNLTLRADFAAHVHKDATGEYQVGGTFKTESANFPNVRLMDGSTLDLKGWTGTFGHVSACANRSGPLKLTFDDGAAVTVDVAGRSFEIGDRIVSWDAPPLHPTFSFDAATAAGGVAPGVAADGLTYGCVAGVVELAWWTGAANDGNVSNPANWLCKDAGGGTVAGALPTSDTQVYLEGTLNAVTLPADFACRRCTLCDVTLAGDCDLRALGANLHVADGAMIDLNGHRLYAPSVALTGSCTVKGAEIGHDDDLTAADAARISSPTTFYIAGMTALNLFNNNYARAGTDNNRRIIVATNNLPLAVTYDFGEAKVVDAYRIWTGPMGSWERRRLPRIWKFEGSNDNASWALLDARHAEAEWTAANRHRMYAFANTTAYRYYRMTVEAAQTTTDGYLELVQLEYFHLKPTQGELHIDSSPGGSDKINLPGLTLDGNMRLFVEGSGAVRFTRTGQTYVGGTEIVGGTVIPESGTNWVHCAALFGEEGGEVVLRGNGSGEASASSSLLDFAGRFGYTGYKFVLAGGTIKNPNESLTELRLDADSYVKATTALDSGGVAWLGSTGAVNTGYADLGGHTLSATADTGRKFGLSNATLENGILYFRSGGWFTTTNSVVATNDVAVKVHGAIDIGGPFAVGDYIPDRLSFDYNMGEYDVDVYRTLVIDGKKLFHGATLHDGAAIDLGACTEPLDVVAPFTEKDTATGVRTLHFEPGATIGVKFGSRRVAANTQVIAWTADTRPDATVKFTSADAGAKFRFEARADGLYVVPVGFMMIVR